MHLTLLAGHLFQEGYAQGCGILLSSLLSKAWMQGQQCEKGKNAKVSAETCTDAAGRKHSVRASALVMQDFF